MTNLEILLTIYSSGAFLTGILYTVLDWKFGPDKNSSNLPMMVSLWPLSLPVLSYALIRATLKGMWG